MSMGYDMSKSNIINNDLSSYPELLSSQVSPDSPNAFLVTDSSGVVSNTSSLTDGQVVIGATGGTPVAAQITGGTGVQVTNAPGSITISEATKENSLKAVQYITSGSGTYSMTAGTTCCLVICVGAGGGGAGVTGGSSTDRRYTSGGGGGGVAYKFFSTAPDGASYSVGTGGAGGATGSGADGGDTSFDTGFYATGGKGGDEAYTSTINRNVRSKMGVKSAGGVGFGGFYTSNGGPSSSWVHGKFERITNYASAGGASGLGGGGSGISAVNENGITPSSSYPGVGGGGVYVTTTSSSGGSGTNGMIVIYEYGA